MRKILTDAAGGDVTAASEPRSVSWRDHRVLCWRKNTGGALLMPASITASMAWILADRLLCGD
jgi:hypothetical protein